MQGSHPEFEHIPTARWQLTTTAVESSNDEEARRTASASRTSRRPPTAKINTRRQIHQWPAGRRATGHNASHRAPPSTMPEGAEGCCPRPRTTMVPGCSHTAGTLTRPTRTTALLPEARSEAPVVQTEGGGIERCSCSTSHEEPQPVRRTRPDQNHQATSTGCHPEAPDPAARRCHHELAPPDPPEAATRAPATDPPDAATNRTKWDGPPNSRTSAIPLEVAGEVVGVLQPPARRRHAARPCPGRARHHHPRPTATSTGNPSRAAA